MRILLFIISSSVFFINCSLLKNDSNSPDHINPLVKTWKINGIAFVNTKTDIYQLTPRTLDKFQFGHFVTFSENGTFHGFYRAKCGNDCFTSVEGTYRFIDKNKISVFIKEIQKGRFCSEKSMVLNKPMGFFELEQKSADKIILTRTFLEIEEEETQECDVQ